MSRKRLTVLILISAGIIAVAAFAIFIVIGVGNGTISLGNTPIGNFVSNGNNSASGKWNEGIITYNGEKYRYNSSIRTYLIMGIDKSGPAAPAKDHVSGGQSDGMFLLVIDKNNEKISVIPINRNTMADVRFCDKDGNYYGTFQAQICLQHGFGDGMKESCQNSVNAVSKLFYDIPISGYIAMNMDAMMILNRLAGGVTVEVLEDIDYEPFDVHLKAGETVTLTDEEAYAYLRYRDVKEFGTASRRLEREKQYGMRIYEKLKVASEGSSEKAGDMYKELEDYIVTNVVFADIAEDLLDYGFSEASVYDIPGDLKLTKNLEEFYIDKSLQYDIILSIMYQKL